MNSSDKRKNVDHRRTRRRAIKKGTSVECRKGTLGLGSNVALDKVDISEEGIQLVVSKAFLPGDEIEVKLAAPGMSESISRIASVVWCRMCENGTFLVGARMHQSFDYVDIAHCT